MIDIDNPPRKPSILELLCQDTWWQPQHGPRIPVAKMTDTHRLHTAAWLFKRARGLAELEAWDMISSPLRPSGDMACDAFDREVDDLMARPDEWMRERLLFGALLADLPTPDDEAAWADLLGRAAHWSTCPRNRVLNAPVCTCTPVTNGLDDAGHFRARLAGSAPALGPGRPA